MTNLNLTQLVLAMLPVLALAQTPACLLAVVNQVDDPSNVASVCSSNVAAQIPNVCHGNSVAEASSAFSAICAAAPSASSASKLPQATSGATIVSLTSPLSSTPFTITANTPILTGGFTTQAGTPTYAPVGPVAFNTYQAPSSLQTSYAYAPSQSGGTVAPPSGGQGVGGENSPPASTPTTGAVYTGQACCTGNERNWALLLLMGFILFY